MLFFFIHTTKIWKYNIESKFNKYKTFEYDFKPKPSKTKYSIS